MIFESILFCNRINNIRNSLPPEIVTAPTLNSLKNRLTNIDCKKKLSVNGNLIFQELRVEITYLVLVKLVKLSNLFLCL